MKEIGQALLLAAVLDDVANGLGDLSAQSSGLSSKSLNERLTLGGVAQPGEDDLGTACLAGNCRARICNHPHAVAHR